MLLISSCRQLVGALNESVKGQKWLPFNEKVDAPCDLTVVFVENCSHIDRGRNRLPVFDGDNGGVAWCRIQSSLWHRVSSRVVGQSRAGARNPDSARFSVDQNSE